MKQHLLAALAAVLILAGAAFAQVSYSTDFTTALACGASGTITNGTDFDSVEVGVPAGQGAALITVTFTRAAGSTSKVSFYFQVSHDNGSTWADFVDPVSGAEYIEVATNHAVVSGTTVRVSQVFMLSAGHIRLSKVVNADSGNALTAVNASISF